MEAFGLTLEMVVVLCVLGLTVFLFVSEIVRVDVAAIIIMVLLGCLAAVPGLENKEELTEEDKSAIAAAATQAAQEQADAAAGAQKDDR